MAHRFSDGCTKTATILHIYTSVGGGAQSYVAGTGRFGLTGLQISGSQCWVAFPDNPSTLLMAFAYNPSTITQRAICNWSDGAFTRQLTLRLNNDGTISIVRGGVTGTVLATSTASFLANVFNHFEMKAFINNTTGTFELRLNGNTTPILTFTGNTQGAGTAVINQVALENTVSANVWYSDIHIWDTAGAAPTGFLGNKRIYTQAPTSDGATDQFSTQPSQSAGSHFLNVDEMPPNEDTDYNFDSTNGHRESYGFSALPTGVQGITEVVDYARVRIDDAGPHTYQVGSRSSGTDSLSSDINPGASYAYGKQAVSLDPNGSVAWTKSAVDAATLEVVITS